MCDCRERIEADVEKRYVEKNPSGVEVKARLQGYALMLTGGRRPYMPVEVAHTVTVKSTGQPKRKIEKMTMLFSFCPFCGKRVPT